MRDIDWDKVPDIEWDAIGGEIKRRRKLKGLSQEQLAQMVGIALSSIRRERRKTARRSNNKRYSGRIEM